LLELAASCVQRVLILPQLYPVLADFLQVISDFLPVLKDFLFTGSVADIPSKLGAIFSQLLIIRAQFSATSLDFLAGGADVLEVLPNLRLVVTAPIVMTNITPEVPFVMSLVMSLPPFLMTVPFAVIAAPLSVMVIAAVVMIAAIVLRIGCRGQYWDR
jgi:hypothetical protein